MNRRKQNFANRLLVFIVGILLVSAGIGLGIIYSDSQRTSVPNNVPDGQLIFQEANISKIEEILKVQNELNKKEVQAVTIPQSSEDAVNSGRYVASSRGKKYYPEDCSAAKSLSSSNLIYFTSQEEAEANGYSKSASCEF